jgi:hypothetical protein
VGGAVNRSKNIGTAAESAVVRYAQDHGYPGARRVALAGALDRGDVMLTDQVVVEVKSGEAAITASDRVIADWLDETERERVNAGATIGLLVTKRRAVGPGRAGQWWCHMRLSTVMRLTDSISGHGTYAAVKDLTVRMTLADVLTLLHAAGHGEAL